MWLLISNAIRVGCLSNYQMRPPIRGSACEAPFCCGDRVQHHHGINSHAWTEISRSSPHTPDAWMEGHEAQTYPICGIDAYSSRFIDDSLRHQNPGNENGVQLFPLVGTLPSRLQYLELIWKKFNLEASRVDEMPIRRHAVPASPHGTIAWLSRRSAVARPLSSATGKYALSNNMLHRPP
jgi:hypothetical protein